MSTPDRPQSWVVYTTAARGRVCGHAAVCDQAAWEALDRAQPGFFTLLRAGIATLTEAAWLARDADGPGAVYHVPGGGRPAPPA